MGTTGNGISRRKFVGLSAITMLAAGGMGALAGCASGNGSEDNGSGSNSETDDNAGQGESGPVTLTFTEAIASQERSIWFIAENVTKDEKFAIFVFENDLASFYNPVMTFGEISGMSDDELLEVVAQSAKAKEPDVWHTPNGDVYEHCYAENVPYSITITTDGSGNHTESEGISLDLSEFDTGGFQESHHLQFPIAIATLRSPKFSYITSSPYEVYEDRYAGYYSSEHIPFVQRISDENVTYRIDDPKTPGIEVY